MSSASAPASLNRSVPFLAESCRSGTEILLLDRFELPLDEISENSAILQKIVCSLNTAAFGEVLSPEGLEVLLAEQFAAASEYVYGHQFWQLVREGSRPVLHAYLLETRHYLAAAASRMSPSIGTGIGLTPLTLLLSQHLLEEWDHAKFFSEALEHLGCSPALSRSARPIPATLEWIHATRSIAFKSSLSAAVCSGFMEYSSKETEVVRNWHSMLVETGLLPVEANKAIVGHLDTDISFDHSENWKRALHVNGPVTTKQAAELLNDVATIAETIYRWLSALQYGLSSSIVIGLQVLTERGLLTPDKSEDLVHSVDAFNGQRVWPSALMQLANWGNDSGDLAANVVSALTYAIGSRTSDVKSNGHDLITVIARNASLLSPEYSLDKSSASSLEATVASWLRSIDGHALWDNMSKPDSRELVTGYILENYHYLASAARHIGAAISSCTYASIRLQLIEHLQDELQHCDILEEKLISVAGVHAPHLMRPLSTTVAFVGFLESLGRQDWKAYIVASAYLQKSLSECRRDQRHSRFYEAVIQNNNSLSELVRSIWTHDDIDLHLGHDDRPLKRLSCLVSKEPVSNDSVELAAVVPALAWSFFDGINNHYGKGRGAVAQRIAWHA